MYDYDPHYIFSKEVEDEKAEQIKVIDAEAKKVEAFKITNECSYNSVEDGWEEIEEEVKVLAEQVQKGEACSISEKIKATKLKSEIVLDKKMKMKSVDVKSSMNNYDEIVFHFNLKKAEKYKKENSDVNYLLYQEYYNIQSFNFQNFKETKYLCILSPKDSTPSNADAKYYLDLGRKYSFQHDQSNAKICFKKAMLLDSKNASRNTDILYYYGDFKFKLKEFKQAELFFRKLIELKDIKNIDKAYDSLSKLLIVIGKPNEAIKYDRKGSKYLNGLYDRDNFLSSGNIKV